MINLKVRNPMHSDEHRFVTCVAGVDDAVLTKSELVALANEIREFLDDLERAIVDMKQ